MGRLTYTLTINISVDIICDTSKLNISILQFNLCENLAGDICAIPKGKKQHFHVKRLFSLCETYLAVKKAEVTNTANV